MLQSIGWRWWIRRACGWPRCWGCQPAGRRCCEWFVRAAASAYRHRAGCWCGRLCATPRGVCNGTVLVDMDNGRSICSTTGKPTRLPRGYASARAPRSCAGIAPAPYADGARTGAPTQSIWPIAGTCGTTWPSTFDAGSRRWYRQRFYRVTAASHPGLGGELLPAQPGLAPRWTVYPTFG
jgi:hypothetical protein